MCKYEIIAYGKSQKNVIETQQELFTYASNHTEDITQEKTNSPVYTKNIEARLVLMMSEWQVQK